MPSDRLLALNNSAWPFAEARQLLERVGNSTPEKGYVLFETGYGPSGLPHIGTFAEVARTTMIRNAFHVISDIPTKLFAFSDDMDGLRRVPDNVPNREMLREKAEVRDKDDQPTARGGFPLTAIEDPFGGCHESFGHHNNARLRAFLDAFGFDYEFVSATECYRSGRFDATLLEVLRRYDEVMAVVLPSLRPKRRETYCPFLPISPKSGRVLHVPAQEVRPDKGTIIFRDEEGETFEAPVTSGHCKLQWRVDWAMRWRAFEVDYEMSGKDLIDSVKLSSRICRILGGRPPEGFTYELFLDENGEKISKSKGNGLTIEEWLRYGSPESLVLYMYHHPRQAKRLYVDVIPRHVDEYLNLLESHPEEPPEKRLSSPLWHIHAGRVPAPDAAGLSYGVLLNLASVTGAEDKNLLWGFISRYAPEATPEKAPILDELTGYAINYALDFVKPAKSYRPPDAIERAALEDLVERLQRLPPGAEPETIQNELYEVGKRHPFESLRQWFRALYEILLGQSQGPRMGSFIALYGIDETVALIRRALRGENLVA